MAQLGAARVSRVSNPYDSDLIGQASVSLGAEATNTITATVTAKDGGYNPIGVGGPLNCYLSSDSAGAVPLLPHQMPSGGYAAGASGAINKRAAFQDSALLVAGALAIDVVPEKFKTT